MEFWILFVKINIFSFLIPHAPVQNLSIIKRKKCILMNHLKQKSFSRFFLTRLLSLSFSCPEQSSLALLLFWITFLIPPNTPTRLWATCLACTRHFVSGFWTQGNYFHFRPQIKSFLSQGAFPDSCRPY